jgi:dihydrofolate reductase
VGKVVIDMSMSLDGFIAMPNDSPEHPLGEGGQRLHEWLFNESEYARAYREAVKTTGAVIMGRRTFNFHPSGPYGLPAFVLTHDPKGLGRVL